MLAARTARDWIRIGEAAGLLGVSEQTLRNWDRSGRLPARRHPINGYRLYRAAEVHGLLRETDTPGTQRPVASSSEDEGLPSCHWDMRVALDPKHRPQVWDLPSSTVRRDWRKFPQEAHVIRRDGRAYRRFTPAEIALLQGLPESAVPADGHTVRERIAAAGDSVPPPLAQAIGTGLTRSVELASRSAIEVCVGIGGMLRGMQAAGFEHLAAIDRDEVAHDLLVGSGEIPAQEAHLADVREFDFGTLETSSLGLLCGGPPCQPWSQSGHRLGTLDKRDLMGWLPTLVSQLRPEAFVFENVPGLLTRQNRSYLASLISRFRRPAPGLQYGVAIGLFNSADFGVPQIRRRIFLVGLRGRSNGCAHRVFDAAFRERTHRGPDALVDDLPPWRTVGDALEDRPDPGGWRRWLS